MRSLLIIIAVATTLNSFGQPAALNRNEFSEDGSGLMYSPSDMKKLRHIVDSLNIRFKACESNPVYYSRPQTYVYRVYFKSDTSSLKEIANSLKNNESYEEVITKYRQYIKSIDSSDLIIEGGPSSEKKRAHHYLNGDPGSGYDHFLEMNLRNELTKNSWVYEYSVKGKYIESNSIIARHFSNKFVNAQIPAEYARYIQYVDCMIDTSTSLFTTNKYRNWSNQKAVELDIFYEVRRYLSQNYKALRKSPEDVLDSANIAIIESLKKDETFKSLLSDAIDEYLENKKPQIWLGSVAAEVGLYEKALMMRRSYRVMGYCSQDRSPRYHVREIAILSAQSNRWDVFLRSHLDIMNDRFDRQSDGSYAYASRKTYLKELEELDLNVVDLMLGLSMRAQNLSGNHYYGTIWRLGWALTESREKERFETTAMQMIKDDRLDDFNRGLIFMLYKNYLYRLDDSALIKSKMDALKNTANDFPAFIRPYILELTMKDLEK